MKSEWDASIEETAAENMALCSEIQECRRQLEHWKGRLSQLLAQQKRRAQPAVVYQNPGQWNRLKRKDKWERENVKAVLTAPDLICLKVPLPNMLHDWSQTPPHIRDDRELFTYRLPHQPPVENYLPAYTVTNRADLNGIMQFRPVLLAKTLPDNSFVWSDHELYVSFWKTIPLKSVHCITLDRFEEVLLKFDFSLRNDPKLLMDKILPLMMATEAVAVEKYLTCWGILLRTCANHRPKPEAPLLRNRKEVAEVLLRHRGDLLQYFSRRIQDLAQLVTLAVQQNGRALRFASYRLRRNSEVVTTALEKNATALVYALHRKRLVRSDVKYALAYFEHRPVCLRDGGASCPYNTMWKMIPRKFQENASVLAAALSCSVLIKDGSLLSKVDWRTAVQKYPELWGLCGDQRPAYLPRIICSMTELVIAIERFPQQLGDNRDFWLVVARSGLLRDLYEDDEMLVPEFVFTDKEIAVAGCHQDYKFIELLMDRPLSVDRDVLEAAFDNCPLAIEHVTENAQVLHPDLVARAIAESGEEYDMWELLDSIDEDVWMNREVATAWIRAGGDFLQDEFPDEFEDDEELFLLVAEYCPQDFWYVSNTLSSNVEFMEKVIRVNPQLLRVLPLNGDLLYTNHFKLALYAFSASRDLPGLFDMKNTDDLAWITEFAAIVRNKLLCHRAFLQVLAGIQFGSDEDPLRQLNQGRETCTGFKQLTSEFLGVPSGAELKQLRRASFHLALWSY